MPRIGLLFLLGVLVLVAAGCGGGSSNEKTITIEYSKFAPEVVEVIAGRPVTITLRNDDPIEHEWIVGADSIHDTHRTGVEPLHDTLPTEVTVPAFSTRETTIIFDTPGDYAYICHLPGHEAYGMVGTLRVVEA